MVQGDFLRLNETLATLRTVATDPDDAHLVNTIERDYVCSVIFVVVMGLWALLAGGGSNRGPVRSSPASTAATRTATTQVPPDKVVVKPRQSVSGRDGTTELQQLYAGMSEAEALALGLAVVLTGTDTYATRVIIRNTGNMPVRIYTENIATHFGNDTTGVTTINQRSFLRNGVLEPGHVVTGLVMYRLGSTSEQ